MRVRQFFRVRTTMKQQVALAHQREMFRHQWDALEAMMLVASHPEDGRREVPNTFFLILVFSVLTHSPDEAAFASSA